MPLVIKERAQSIFVHSSGKEVGWTAMASLTARMNPSVSPRSPLNFSGSAPLTGRIEVDEDVGMGMDWAAGTAAAKAALARLF